MSKAVPRARSVLLLWMILSSLLPFYVLAQPNVVAWGNNDFGQTNVPSDLTNAVAISAGGYFSLALRADGTVTAWGVNDSGQINVPPGLSNVISVAAGANQALALKEDGTVVGWGGNQNGQASPPTNLADVVDICAGTSASYAVLGDGSAVSWGLPKPFPVGLGSTITLGRSLSYREAASPVTVGGTAFLSGYGLPTNIVLSLSSSGPALRTDGRVTLLSGDAGLSDIVALSGGPSFAYLALRTDGTIYRGPTDLANVVAIDSGNYHNLALIGQGPHGFPRGPAGLRSACNTPLGSILRRQASGRFLTSGNSMVPICRARLAPCWRLPIFSLRISAHTG